jgi:hypothetical protein
MRWLRLTSHVHPSPATSSHCCKLLLLMMLLLLVVGIVINVIIASRKARCQTGLFQPLQQDITEIVCEIIMLLLLHTDPLRMMLHGHPRVVKICIIICEWISSRSMTMMQVLRLCWCVMMFCGEVGLMLMSPPRRRERLLNWGGRHRQ